MSKGIIQVNIVLRVPDDGQDTVRAGITPVGIALQELFSAVRLANGEDASGKWFEHHDRIRLDENGKEISVLNVRNT